MLIPRKYYNNKKYNYFDDRSQGEPTIILHGQNLHQPKVSGFSNSILQASTIIISYLLGMQA